MVCLLDMVQFQLNIIQCCYKTVEIDDIKACCQCDTLTQRMVNGLAELIFNYCFKLTVQKPLIGRTKNLVVLLHPYLSNVSFSYQYFDLYKIEK